MTLLALSSIDYDPDGSGLVRLLPGSRSAFHVGQRRQTKTATLDGGVSLYDTGYTETDNTYQLRITPTPEALRLVEYMCRNYQRIRCGTDRGVYEVSLSGYRLDGDALVVDVSILGEP